VNAEIPDDLIEIHDPEIDPSAIIAQIRERVRVRRQEMGYENHVFPTFGATPYPGEPDRQPFDRDLYYHLRLANETYVQAETDPALAPSQATRIPVLGRLWALIRREAHNLILFYVNRAIAQQTDVNRHLVSVLNQLTVLCQKQQQELDRLQTMIETLGRSAEEHT
jgi:hypothetical protein